MSYVKNGGNNIYYPSQRLPFLPLNLCYTAGREGEKIGRNL
jgi:hypothetical protein